jgi:hypothetical protein
MTGLLHQQLLSLEHNNQIHARWLDHCHGYLNFTSTLCPRAQIQGWTIKLLSTPLLLHLSTGGGDGKFMLLHVDRAEIITMRHQFATRQLLSSQDQFCCTRKW